MTELLVREAVLADLDACVRMLVDDQLGQARDKHGDQLDPGYLDAFEAIAKTPGHSLLVAELEGEVIGVLQLMILPHLTHVGSSRAQIEGVRIAAPHRGQGHGQVFLRAAIECAREAGASMVQLTTNAARHEARRFYEQLGFTPSHVGMKLALD